MTRPQTLATGQPEALHDPDEITLLSEAVTALIQRQREMEEWLREEISRTSMRVGEAQRLQSVVQERLAAIEADLASVLPQLGQTAAAPRPATQHLEPLRQQLDWLQGATRPLIEPPRSDDPQPAPTLTAQDATVTRSNLIRERIGATLQERLGAAFIALGGFGLLYAVAVGIRVA